jgi:putative transposase
MIDVLTERASPMRFLIHDRDTKFTAGFDEVFRSEGMRVIHTPVRAPQANAVMERWFGTLRRECLDWLLILGHRHLERVLRIYVSHYNEHRPHRSLDQQAPTCSIRSSSTPSSIQAQVRRHDRLGGLIHEYEIAA